MHTINSSRTHVGDIVNVERFPYSDGTGHKNRYAVVVASNGPRVVVRGIYTKRGPGYKAIAATYETGLDHVSWVARDRTEIDRRQINRVIGSAPWDFEL